MASIWVMTGSDAPSGGEPARRDIGDGQPGTGRTSPHYAPAYIARFACHREQWGREGRTTTPTSARSGARSGLTETATAASTARD